MKITVLGDIHGELCWNDIIAKENDSDLFIFLGDYVSTHKLISEDQQCANLEDILNFKQENPDKVILLRGNHDCEALDYYWAECHPSTGKIIKRYMAEQKDRFLKLTQWVFVWNGIVFSHAGITQRWWDDMKNKFGLENIEDINKIEPNEMFGFRPCKMSDYSGISTTQGCTWIRPTGLYSYGIKDTTYIVGHTQLATRKIEEFGSLIQRLYPDLVNENGIKIWCCDNLPDQYLVINDNEFIVKNVTS